MNIVRSSFILTPFYLASAYLGVANKAKPEKPGLLHSPMPSRLSSVIGWICTILIAALNIFAGIMKFMPVTDPVQLEMMQSMGMTPGLVLILGVFELAIVMLFLIPRTSTVGFVLMVGYFGGVLATMLTHGLDATFIYVVFVLLTLSAWFRNPELTARLMGRTIA